MREARPFGEFMLLERIAVGGMAEVFKAVRHDDKSRKIVAVKRILPSLGSDKEFVSMFEDEARLVSRLNHENISTVLSHGRIDGTHFIEMEYLSGLNLLQIMERYKQKGLPTPIPWAVFVLSKILSALFHAHSMKDSIDDPLQIIHRDCSPQNMLVGFDGDVRLIDFGIAKAAVSSIRTNDGVLKGKFGYMSPEQVRGDVLDQRSDLFSVGTVLAELISGVHPFKGESDFATLENVREADVELLSALRGDASKKLDAVLKKALAKNLNERYKSADAFRLDLEKLLMAAPGVVDKAYVGLEVRRLFTNEYNKEMAWEEDVADNNRESEQTQEKRPQTAQVFVSSQTGEGFSVQTSKQGMEQPRTSQTHNTVKTKENRSLGWVVGLALSMLLLGGIGFGLVSAYLKPPVDAPQVVESGVLAVVVADGRGGNLFVNGVDKGYLDGEKTFNGLPAGGYDIRLERAGYEPFVEKRELLQNGVEIVTAKFTAKPTTSIVLLEGLKDDDRVVLNGQEVSLELVRLGMVVESNKKHRVVIRRRSKAIDRFELQLERGETLAHQIPEVKKNNTAPKEAVGEAEGTPVFPLELGKDLYEKKNEDIDARMGFFTAFTKPYARVFVDGVDTGQMTPITPSRRLALAPGRHKIVFKAEGQAFEYSVVIQKGEMLKFAKVLKAEVEQ